MENLFEAESPEERERILVETIGVENANAVASRLGLQVSELFSDEIVNDGTGNRSVGEFLTCMRSEVTDDLKSIFDINAIAALIGREKYWEAAVEAVKFLAKQGIKRNVAGLAATLAFYGGKCAWARIQG
ncbi:hypothetical protein [Corynebacterium liangguodongii]|uniref:Uncharacterized protein n=1 Tax=Corynebacterium liangguodongii TaxID=2079535 RepID=A0A2S0WEI1_9CORY|nr:hypothetical protein [Corynebacterium liangguodongii]AWB84187.1 hypothetical protein C3E79_06615 [Corynebacterium liangguodongii]PWC00197.1 hypothetical protein DF219_03250 [Corynebacterium liangguodongii]